MPKEKLPVTELDVLQEILKVLKSINQKTEKGEKPLPNSTDTAPLPVIEKPLETIGEPAPSNYPIPQEYREIIETTLNKEFGIELVPISDRPAFQLSIIVPDSYSNSTAEYRKMYGGDKRTKTIDFSQGVNGVREWAEKVYNNLSQDARTKIALAREQGK